MDIIALKNALTPKNLIPDDASAISSRLENVLPTFNHHVKRMLHKRYHSDIPMIEVIPPTPDSSVCRKKSFAEAGKIFVDTLEVCRLRIRRFSEPNLKATLHVQTPPNLVRRKSAPCISNKNFLQVPKARSKTKRRERRYSLPSNNELPTYANSNPNCNGNNYKRRHSAVLLPGDVTTNLSELRKNISSSTANHKSNFGDERRHDMNTDKADVNVMQPNFLRQSTTDRLNYQQQHHVGSPFNLNLELNARDMIDLSEKFRRNLILPSQTEKTNFARQSRQDVDRFNGLV